MNSLTREQTNFLRVICIFVIIIHHWSQTILLSDFYFLRSIGAHCCGIFYFLSGYGLYSSYIKNDKLWIDNFFGKRLKNILYPFIFANILYLIYNNEWQLDIICIIKYILGIKLINGHFWFLQALILLYVCTYISFRYYKKKFIFQILIISLGNAIFILGGNLGTLTTILFPLGIIYKKYENRLANKLNINIYFFIFLLLFICSYYVVFYKNILMRILFFPNILISVYIALCACRKIKNKYKLIDYFAPYIFFLYMMNAFSVYFLRYIDNIIKYETICLCLYILFNIILSIVFKKISDSILNKI